MGLVETLGPLLTEFAYRVRTTMDTLLLSEDLEYFLALKPFLLRAYKEQYALIKDQALHGAYATFAEAYKLAWRSRTSERCHS